jgi:hypothetical protein
VYAWAPGGDAWALPDFLGLPFNAEGEYRSFVIQVHYNNQRMTPGILDSSGARFYWTSQPREVEMGIFSTADPLLDLFGRPVGNGLTTHDFVCPSSCTNTVLENQPITVLREYLHMHRTGARATNEQIRDGEVIHTGVVDYYDFDQNGNGEIVQDAFIVEAGDSFRTSCYYDATGETTFGEGSQDEMCIVFMFYYPRVNMEVNTLEIFGFDLGIWQLAWTCGFDLDLSFCATSYTRQNVASVSVEALGRNFGVPEDECPESEMEDNPTYDEETDDEDEDEDEDEDDETDDEETDDEETDDERTDDTVESAAHVSILFPGGVTALFAGFLLI